MTVSSQRTMVRSGSHWGIFTAEVEEGRVVGVRPFEKDPRPSDIIQAIPSAVHSQCRVLRPMVRKGWLEEGPKSPAAGRGAEPFIPLSWDRALDLVAQELARVKKEYGNEAIYASSGWASAGCFHHAQAQLTRFLNGFGGFVSQVTNYSFGAASVIVPRIVGTMQPVTGPMTSWPTIGPVFQVDGPFRWYVSQKLPDQQGWGGQPRYRGLDGKSESCRGAVRQH